MPLDLRLDWFRYRMEATHRGPPSEEPAMSRALDILAFSHIGFAVDSVDEFIDTWGAALGIPDWHTYEAASSGGIQLHGSDTGPVVVQVAFARLGGTSLELIETKEGRTHHLETVERRGSGLHHVAFWVRDLAAELAKAPSLGLEIVTSPSNLRPELRDRPVSAVVQDPGAVKIPQYFAFLDTIEGRSHFGLELLDARFAEDYRAMNGPHPYYPGELPT
jgi:methylmalonyl-CoA/ethylmalonyl-CoA epimerase